MLVVLIPILSLVMNTPLSIVDTLAISASVLMLAVFFHGNEKIQMTGVILGPQMVVLLNRHAGIFTVPQIVLIIVVILCLVMRLFARSRSNKKMSRIERRLASGVFLFTISIVIGVYHGDEDITNRLASAFYNTKPILFGVLVYLTTRTLEGARYINKIIMAEIVGIALLTILVYTSDLAFHIGGYSELETGEYHRAAMGFGSSNILGVFFAIGIALVSATMIGRGSFFKGRYVKWIVFAIITTGLLITYSRRGWIAALVAIVISLVMIRRSPLAIVSSISVVVLVVFLAPDRVENRAATMMDPEYASNVQRLIEWDFFWQRIAESPIIGFGSGEIDRGQGKTGLNANVYFHNYYLSLGYEYGMFGLVAYFFLWGSVLWILREAYKTREKEPVPPIGLLVGVVVLIAGTAGTTNVTFPVGFICYIVVGAALSNADILKRTRDKDAGVNRKDVYN